MKGEIGGCDVLAIRDGEPPLLVICELKQRFNLELVLQGVDRAAACDEVWLAARVSARGAGRESHLALSQPLPPPRLRPARGGRQRHGRGHRQPGGAAAAPRTEAPLAPDRRVSQTQGRSCPGRQHARAADDALIASAALLCAAALVAGPQRARADPAATVPEAPKILPRNVYGWFDRLEHGIYALTDQGPRRARALAAGRSPGELSRMLPFQMTTLSRARRRLRRVDRSRKVSCDKAAAGRSVSAPSARMGGNLVASMIRVAGYGALSSSGSSFHELRVDFHLSSILRSRVAESHTSSSHSVFDAS